MEPKALVVDQTTALFAALGICIFLVGAFMFFAHRCGALKKVGREPMSDRMFLSLGAMALLPALSCLSAVGLCSASWAMENPWILAGGMAGCAGGGHWAMSRLARLARDPV